MTRPAELDDTATAAPTPAPPLGDGDGLASGARLGHFRVERKLGAGGMGEVYLATDLALDRPVALKVLPNALARDGSRRERMIREARAQARINHPNVGHIYFIGEDAGRLYFAMEYVAGQTLAERLAAGPLPVDDALAFVRAAALGLREAHRSGFTHRDVKPSNLMVDAHGMVKVLDFGLVSGTFVEDAAARVDTPSPQTSLAGTPLYMAPEQGRGDSIDFRADIYALGATLYHLVSGKPPFVADTAGELMSLHASAKRPALPRGPLRRSTRTAVDDLCTRMMSPAPTDRFASYDDLLRSIELVSTTHTRPAGFWVRVAATFIDMMMVMPVMLALVFGITQFTPYALRGDLIPYLMLLVGWTLLLPRNGRSPGKALFELEVVDLATGRPPRRRQAFARSLVMLGPMIGFGLLTDLFTGTVHTIGQLGVAVALPAGFVLLLVGALASPTKRAVWDRVAHTMVRYRRATP